VSRLRTPPAKATTMTRFVLYLPAACFLPFLSWARAKPGNPAAPSAATPASLMKSRRCMSISVALVFAAGDERAHDRLARGALVERLLVRGELGGLGVPREEPDELVLDERLGVAVEREPRLRRVEEELREHRLERPRV